MVFMVTSAWNRRGYEKIRIAVDESRSRGYTGSSPGGLRRDGAWRSLVAHLLWEQGVAGSNPAAPTSAPRWAGQSCAHSSADRATAF